MDPGRRDRLLTGGIVLLAVAGILFFAIRAAMDQRRTDGENPYAYDLSAFDQTHGDSLSYTQVRSIPVDLSLPVGIALDNAGFLYVSGGTVVVRVDSTGHETDRFDVGGTAYCLALDNAHRIFLGLGDRVGVWDPVSRSLTRWESLGPNALLTSIAASDSLVYVADAGQLRVWVFTTSGTLKGTVGSRNAALGAPGFVVPSPYFDVAVGPNGTLWVANTGRHALESYAPGGALVASWGEYSTAVEGFVGCCNPSHFALTASGAFVTAEKGIPRVKVYGHDGQLIALVAGPEQFRPGTVGLDLAVDASGRIYVLDPAQKAVRIYSRIRSSTEGADP